MWHAHGVAAYGHAQRELDERERVRTCDEVADRVDSEEEHSMLKE